MESGQVKTGNDPGDTYAKMLQNIMSVTSQAAYAIAAEYPTVQRLVKGLVKNGPLALEDCMKSSNKNGAFNERRVGKQVSKRVYRCFTERDAESWDV